MKKKLIIFDVGGVLTSTSKEKDKIAKAVGLSLEQFRQYTDDLFDSNNGEVEDCWSIDSREFWSEFNKRSGLNVKCDWLHLFFHPELNKDTVKLIKKLKKMGYRVVAGTNTCTPHYQNHMERGDYQVFDQTYASIFMGCGKPDRQFWEIILKAEGDVKPEDCIFIDDKKKNCEVASSMGINAIQFITARQVKKDIFAMLKGRQ